MKNRKRIGGLLLALALTVSMIPQTALAEETTEQTTAGYQTEEQADAAQTEEKTDAVQAQSRTDEISTETNASSDSETVETETGSVSESTDTADTGSDSGAGDKESGTGELCPAVVLNTKADDGTEINITAPEGAFPSGIQVSVTKVDAEKILAALQKASDNSDLTEDQVAAYDFDFYLEDGKHNIEPGKEISVQFSLPELKGDNSVSAYHLKDENSSAEKEDVTTDTASGVATLESEQFSIHVLLLSAAENTSTVKIEYDEKTAIHSVTDSAGNRIILYCMNNNLHWPHATKDAPDVPLYSETTFKEFFDANGIIGDAQDTLKTNLQNLLYAGYPYNGYGLYQVVDKVPTISEEEFNQLLVPPQYLRDDFPNTLGTNTFSYADRTDSSKMELLGNFLIEVGSYLTGGTTPSGLNYQQLMQLPFIRAAYCMAYTNDPIKSYTEVYLANYLITESQAYGGTRDAIWWVLKKAGLTNNDKEVTETPLVKNLLDADTKNLILINEPNTSDVRISGDLTFYYSTDDKQWHTGRLTLTAPSTYNTKFTLALPDGIKEESGKTQISVGESFSLVSSVKPENEPSITLSAKIPWMDPNLKVYVAGKEGYQNMIGAVIRQTLVSKTEKLSVSTTNFTFTKVWKDGNNQDGKRPEPSTFVSKLHLKADGVEVTGYKPTVTDNGNGTWTAQYKDLPGLSSGKTYSVTEDSISPYTSDSDSVADGGTLTNRYTPETVTVSGKKTWNDGNNQDGKRPESITVRLWANNVEKAHTTVKADADGNWTYSFENLPKYEDGREIAYTVTEDAVAEYSTEIKDYNITNSYTPGKTSVTVTKAWDDQDNQDGKRQPVQVQLYADNVEKGDPVTLSEGMNWTYTWDDLAEKKAGKVITYTVRELTEIPGYTSQVTGDAKTGFTVINTRTLETMSFTFTKKWVDSGNKDGTRPGVGSFIQSISLMDGDGKVNGYTPDVKDNGDNTYTVIYSGLPKYKDGKEISYFVQESNIAGYAQSTSTVKNGETLTNTKVKAAMTVSGGGSSPKTGDHSNIYLYGIAGASAFILLLLLFMWKKRRDRKAE